MRFHELCLNIDGHIAICLVIRTGLDRQQVNALIHEIEGVKIVGHGRGAKYVLDQ